LELGVAFADSQRALFFWLLFFYAKKK
jgi:hypothetical protein